MAIIKTFRHHIIELIIASDLVFLSSPCAKIDQTTALTTERTVFIFRRPLHLFAALWAPNSGCHWCSPLTTKSPKVQAHLMSDADWFNADYSALGWTRGGGSLPIRPKVTVFNILGSTSS